MEDIADRPPKRLKSDQHTAPQAPGQRAPSQKETHEKFVKENATKLATCYMFEPKYTTVGEYELDDGENDPVIVVDEPGKKKRVTALQFMQTKAFLLGQKRLIIDTMITKNNLGSTTGALESAFTLMGRFGLPKNVHASYPKEFIDFVRAQILFTFQSIGSDLKSKGYVTLDKEDRKVWHPLARDIVQSEKFKGSLPQICRSEITKHGLTAKCDSMSSQQKGAQKLIDSAITKLTSEKKIRRDQAGDLLMLALRRSTRPVRILEGMKIKQGRIETSNGEVGRLSSKSKDECEGLRVSKSGVIESKNSIFLGTVEPVPGNALEELWMARKF